MQEGWKYYNHAIIPTIAPHEIVDESQIRHPQFWKNWEGVPLFARWTSNLDCGYKTNWWYVIKDEPFDIEAIPSRKRYKINKGKKYFDVKLVDINTYADKIANVVIEVCSTYPEAYRPILNEERIIRGLKNSNWVIFAAFERSSDTLCGFVAIEEHDGYYNLIQQKAIQKYEKYQINASMVYYVLQFYSEQLKMGSYIIDGERNLLHKTSFQDYLEDYFGFRKAYCSLNIKYRGLVKMVVKVLFPFRRLFAKEGRLSGKIFSVLSMEEICRAK